MADPARGGGGDWRRLRGRRAERVARRLSRAAAADGDARVALALSGAGRRTDGRGGQLHGPSRRAFSRSARATSPACPRRRRCCCWPRSAVAVLLHTTTRGRGVLRDRVERGGGARMRASKCPIGWPSCYVLSGLAAGLAAIIYVAHLGQAKADAGTGYELTAITAVVLGGAAITGGVGSIGGTLLGLLAMVVLQNGLRLAALPAELAGILTGAAAARRPLRAPALTGALATRAPTQRTSSDEMRNSQLAVLVRRDPAGAPDRGHVELVAGAIAPHDVRAALRPAGRRAGGGARVGRHDAEGEGRSVLRQLPQGRGGSRGVAGRRSDLGRTDRARSREAERGGRGVDHARRGRRRGQRREPGGDLDRAAQGAQPAASRC